MEAICRNCAWWVRGSNNPRNAKFYTDEGGECRRHPPRGGHFHVYQDGENSDLVSIVGFPFPPTHQDDWCGEWKEKP